CRGFEGIKEPSIINHWPAAVPHNENRSGVYWFRRRPRHGSEAELDLQSRYHLHSSFGHRSPSLGSDKRSLLSKSFNDPGLTLDVSLGCFREDNQIDVRFEAGCSTRPRS